MKRTVARDAWTILMAMAAGSFLTQLGLVSRHGTPTWALVLMFIATATNAFSRVRHLTHQTAEQPK